MALLRHEPDTFAGGLLIEQYGQDGEITRDEFMRYGLLAATGYATTQAGIVWATKVLVGETEDEAKTMRERLIADVPMEAVGVWLSHNTGFDMSTLPPRFSVRELNERTIAANASPVGFVGRIRDRQTLPRPISHA